MSRLLSDILVFSAGVDRELLAACPTYERHKYSAMGFAVVLTALFATISGTYSFYTVFGSFVPAILLGGLWGTFIFNLDRLLLTTLRKREGWGHGFGHALIRVLLAMLIGISIAHPVTLRLFQEEINQYLEEARLKRQQSIHAEFERQRLDVLAVTERSLQTSPKYRELRTLESQIEALTADVRSCEARREDARKQSVCECAGTCGTGQEGRGPECRRNERQYADLTTECSGKADVQRGEKERLTRELARVTQQLSVFSKGIEAQRDTGLGALQRDFDQQKTDTDRTFSHAFLARSIALADLTERYPAARTIVRVVILLLVLIEIAPIGAKLIARYDALDAMLEELRTQYVGARAKENTNEYISRRAATRATTRESEHTPTDRPADPSPGRSENPAPPSARVARRVLEVLAYRRFVVTIIPAVVVVGTWYVTGDARVAVGAASLFISMAVAYWTLSQQRGGTT